MDLDAGFDVGVLRWAGDVVGYGISDSLFLLQLLV